MAEKPEPLHHSLLRLLDVREELRIAAEVEIAALKELIRAIRDGELDARQIVISDDGWSILPPEPEDEEANVDFSYGANGHSSI